MPFPMFSRGKFHKSKHEKALFSNFVVYLSTFGNTDISVNHKNYNFLACDWFKNVLFSANSLAKLLSDSLISQSHSKM